MWNQFSVGLVVVVVCRKVNGCQKGASLKLKKYFSFLLESEQELRTSSSTSIQILKLVVVLVVVVIMYLDKVSHKIMKGPFTRTLQCMVAVQLTKTSNAMLAATSQKPPPSFFKRVLPETCVAFSSPAGKVRSMLVS